MFRYRLRTLLILTILGPPVLAGGWFAYREYVRRPDAVLKPNNVLSFGGVTPRIIIQEEEEQKLLQLPPEQLP